MIMAINDATSWNQRLFNRNARLLGQNGLCSP